MKKSSTTNEYHLSHTHPTPCNPPRQAQAAFEFVTKYDLMCNIVHDSPSGQNKEGNMDPLTGGSFRVHVHHEETDQWLVL